MEAEVEGQLFLQVVLGGWRLKVKQGEVKQR